MIKLVMLTAAMCLGACATVPANYGPPQPNSKIGLLLLVDDSPKHSHVGTTAFQNFEKQNATDTNFKSQIEKKIKDVLGAGDYTIESVDPSELLVAERSSLFSYMSSDIHFKESVRIDLDSIASQQSLDFVIVVYPVAGPAWANSSAYVDGYGLYTRCSFGSCAAEALNYMTARIYDVANRSSLKPSGFRFFQRPSLPDVLVPEDPKATKAEDIDAAAGMAVESFMMLFENMLRTSEFII